MFPIFSRYRSPKFNPPRISNKCHFPVKFVFFLLFFTGIVAQFKGLLQSCYNTILLTTVCYLLVSFIRETMKDIDNERKQAHQKNIKTVVNLSRKKVFSEELHLEGNTRFDLQYSFASYVQRVFVHYIFVWFRLLVRTNGL